MDKEDIARKVVAQWHLGQTSQRFESSGMGAETISTGKNDHGGVSYGAYQLSSKSGTLQEYLAQSAYGVRFKGLIPASAEFDAKWREIARSDPEFGLDQHDFIGRSHYLEQIVRLNEVGLHMAGRGRSVQDAVWSTSVQFRDLTPAIFTGALKEKFGSAFALPSLTDHQIVEAVQDYKKDHNDTLFRSSPGLWPGLAKRAKSEKEALLKLADSESLAKAGPIVDSLVSRGRLPDRETAVETPKEFSSLRKSHFQERAADRAPLLSTSGLQRQLNHLGYHGTHGHRLAADGHFGHNTKHAVMAFQQAHHLHVDGVVGKHTLAALEHARHSPLLSEATHPQHALYAQALHGVRRLPEAMFGSARAQHNAAATLTVAAHASGLHRIDHVVLGTDAVRLFAVQGRMDDPAHRRAHVDRMQAVTQTIEHATLAMQKPAMAPEPARAHAFVAAQAGITHRDVTPGMP
ncbi:peptidoglycan-binding domain-containing protein [Cognatiluteimonas profundi]|uniref:peptidoglycan-binding domain-containing protein n=1 Tax=Cognatiluteimonas profundi TaxID=2594501 RepID=UPI00131DA839|nr:peptidoglycan-binding domain-containing protein [Lysobacter profundi]